MVNAWTIRTRRWAGVAVLATAMGAGSLVQTGCTTNPTTGRRQWDLLTRDQELSLGAEAAPQLTQEFGGELPDASINTYVEQIGQRLAREAEAVEREGGGSGEQREWHFTVLNSPVINAFALPGERVFISRGLLEKMTNEAQLAGVLGHEIGHVMARHTNERMSQQIVFGSGGALVGVVAGAVVDNETAQQVLPAIGAASGQLVVLKFSRDQESESDALGIRYMVRTGYDPSAQIEVMEILKAASDGAGGIEWTQTHPLADTRIRRLNDWIRKDYAEYVNNPQYGKFPERFQQNVLDRLRRLPPAPQQQASPTSMLRHETHGLAHAGCTH